jgi:hypothetical protein
MILKIEFSSVDRVDKVDKGVAKSTSIVLVKWIIEEVVMIKLVAVNRLEKHINGVLVRNVANHNGCSVFSPTEDIRSIDN